MTQRKSVLGRAYPKGWVGMSGKGEELRQSSGRCFVAWRTAQGMSSGVPVQLVRKSESGFHSPRHKMLLGS